MSDVLLGEPITQNDSVLQVPHTPTIPYIEGDGIGPDIWRATQRVLDAAVLEAYGGERRIAWREVLAGQKAFDTTENWLPEETLEAFRNYLVGIKGPLTTPVGGGIRSINVAMRQILDLYVCLRPVRYFPGVPSPVRHPERTNMVVFRENSEDIYTGIEFAAGSKPCEEFKSYFHQRFPQLFEKIRFPKTTGIGIKPVSQEGTTRLVQAAIQYAIDQRLQSVTLVHKGNIMKFTEGAFRDWGYQVAQERFGAVETKGGPWSKITTNDGFEIVIKDIIADAFFQQILTRPDEYQVVATLNLNGDYISDALAACVGGIGIAPGGNINYTTGHAIFEATHGTAPKYAGQDKVNPASLILSGEMMLRYLGWVEAADLVIRGIGDTLAAKTVTYDLERLMQGAQLLRCSDFAKAIVARIVAAS